MTGLTDKRISITSTRVTWLVPSRTSHAFSSKHTSEFPPGTLQQSHLANSNMSYRATKPGGWVEFSDWDSTPNSDDGTTKGSMIEKYWDIMVKGFNKAGYVSSPGPQLEKWLKETGFVNVRAEKFRVPIGTWPKDKKHVS